MTTEVETPVFEPESPGKLLAKARWDLGLTVEDVAAELRLSTWQVVALEEDDYANLPGMTYTRGYLRNYARLVGVPVERVLATQGEGNSPEQTTTSRIPVQRQLSSSDRVVKFATFLVIAAIIGLVVMWWQGERGEPQAPVPAAATAPAVMPAPEPAPVQHAVEPTPLPEDIPAAGTDATVPGADAGVQDTFPPAEGGAGAESGAAEAAPATDSGLVLHYRENCWTDVRDADGKRLVYRTVSAGEVLTLEGRPPYSVFFGNAQGVDVEYQGEPVDFVSHVRGVFARFVVGENTPAP